MKKLLAIFLLAFVSQAIGAPAISGVSGTVSHNSSITITGSGFGSKTTAAPLVWDNCSGTLNTPAAVDTKWSGRWPSSASDANWNLQYRQPSATTHNVQPPHSRVGAYLTGTHGDSSNFATGQNVAVWKDFTKVNGGYIYFTWYNYVNPGWVVNTGQQLSDPDGNFKVFGYSVQGSIYELPNNWYISQWAGDGSGLTSNAATDYETIINDDSSQFNGGVFFGHMINPIGGAWTREEVLIKVDPTNGTISYKQDNDIPGGGAEYTGITDPYSGTARSAGLGGYARSNNNTANRRYFADIYMDTTPQRVMIANNATYASATIIEPLIPTAWSDGSITGTVNLGRLSDSGTAYVFVFDAANARNTSGFAVTIGGPPLLRLPIRIGEMLFDGRMVPANDAHFDLRLAANGN